jgi:hypothetical protein
MHALRPLPFAPPIEQGEAFAQWFERLAYEYGTPLATLCTRVGIPTDFNHRRDFLAKPVSPAILDRLSHALRLSNRSILTLMAVRAPPTDLAIEIGFCPKCWSDDLMHGRERRWQSHWLIATTIVCKIHGTLLLAASTQACVKFDPIATADPFTEEALLLSQALQSPSRINTSRAFGLRARDSLAIVTHDLVDALLWREGASSAPPSAAAIFASLLGAQGLETSLLRIPFVDQPDALSATYAFEHRCFVLGLASALLMGCKAPEPVSRSLFTAVSLRKHWLFRFMPTPAFRCLVARARQWPEPYVAKHWVELAPSQRQFSSFPRTAALIQMLPEHRAWHWKHAYGAAQQFAPNSSLLK